jgi:DNA-directed RNA polymerase subunit RPC12/RpoP
MAQITKLFDCTNCGGEAVLSYEPQFGEPIFCPFCSEELIDEEDLELLQSLEDEDDEDDDLADLYEMDESPLDEMLMEIDTE